MDTQKLADAIGVVFGALGDDHSEQFVQLCLEAGLLWHCPCGWDNPRDQNCEQCGLPQDVHHDEDDYTGQTHLAHFSDDEVLDLDLDDLDL